MEKQSVKTNYIVNVIYELFLLITAFITTPYISRVFGTGGVGECAYYAAYASYFIMFAQLGIPSYGRRAIAKVRDDIQARSIVFSEIICVQMVSSLAVLAAYIAFVHFLLHDSIFGWIYGIQVASSLFDVNWLLWGLEKFKTTVFRNVVVKILSIASIFILVKEASDVTIYAFINASAVLISNLILIPMLKNNISGISFTNIDPKRHLGRILLLLIPSLAVEIYKYMDKSMLGIMTTMDEVGVYESAEKLVRIPLAFVRALGAVMIPRISYLVTKGNDEKSQEYFNKSIIIAMLLSTSMSFGIMGISDVFVPIFFGKGFEKCILLLAILMPSCVFLAFASVVRTQLLLPHDLDKQLTVSLVAGSVVNLIANYFLIPLYGSAGAAAATLFTEFIVAFFQCYFARKYVNFGKHIVSSVPFVLAGFLMCIAIRFMLAGNQPTITLLFIKILTGALAYFVFLFGLLLIFNKKLLKDAFRYLKSYVKKLKRG